MSKPSHIPLFPDAYHRDTTHLSCEEHGAYLLLLMAAWGSDDCSLPDDEKRLAALVKLPVARWRKIAPTVLEFWQRTDGRLAQKRLRKEWLYVRQKSEKARAAVGSRKDRQAYERTTNVGTNGLHLGGGGGEGVGEGYLPRDQFLGEGSNVREDATPFRVIGGGK